MMDATTRGEYILRLDIPRLLMANSSLLEAISPSTILDAVRVAKGKVYTRN